jgi:hypothetical protein
MVSFIRTGDDADRCPIVTEVTTIAYTLVAIRPSAGLVPLALPDLTEIDLSAPAKNAA